MVDFVARLDPNDGTVYIGSVAGYPIPDELWTMLRGAPYFGQFKAGRSRELRLSRTAGAAAVHALRADGHTVTADSGTRAQDSAPRPGLPECQVCGMPYRADYVARPGQLCRNPPTVRDSWTGELVPEHEPHALELGPPPG